MRKEWDKDLDDWERCIDKYVAKVEELAAAKERHKKFRGHAKRHRRIYQKYLTREAERDAQLDVFAKYYPKQRTVLLANQERKSQ